MIDAGPEDHTADPAKAGNLDTENGDRIIDILVQLAHEEKYCVIIATHDMDLLPRW